MIMTLVNIMHTVVFPKDVQVACIILVVQREIKYL